MIRYLIVRLPGLLFEPIAVGALLGGVTALLFCRKKTLFYGILATNVCLMFFWRMGAHSLMLSSRYASIILYPAIILTVWFGFQVRELARWGIRKIPLLNNPAVERICLAIPYFMVFGFAVSCFFLRIMHSDPYEGHTAKLCKTLAGEIDGGDYLLYAQSEPERIAYYSGADFKTILPLSYKTQLPIEEELKDKIARSKNIIDNIYFVFYLRKGDPEPDAQALGIGPELGQWECLHREYTSRKKKKEIVLYRLIPAHPNIEVWDRDIPEISPDNLCKNGNFEEPLAGDDLEQRIDYLRNLGAADFYLAPERRFPVNWWLAVKKEEDGIFSKMSLTEEHPIAGKYSLEMDSNNGANWSANCALMPKQDGVFSGFFRAESDASVLVRSCYWDFDKSTIGYITDYEFRLHPGQTYRFSLPVRMADVPEEDRSINFVVQGIGHILVDNVELIGDRQ